MKSTVELRPCNDMHAVQRSGIRTWITPKLVNFGSISDLTAGGSRFAAEGLEQPGTPGYEFVKP